MKRRTHNALVMGASLPLDGSFCSLTHFSVHNKTLIFLRGLRFPSPSYGSFFCFSRILTKAFYMIHFKHQLLAFFIARIRLVPQLCINI